MIINTNEIKQYIDQNLKEIYSIYTVADQLQLSYHTLRKTFLRRELMSLSDYITSQKVEAMKELLLLDQRQCYYVCFEFGYREDTGAKVFKRATGMTMKEYRLKEYMKRINKKQRKKRGTN